MNSSASESVSARLRRSSSRVRSWQFTPGTSSIQPIHHSPLLLITAVYSISVFGSLCKSKVPKYIDNSVSATGDFYFGRNGEYYFGSDSWGWQMQPEFSWRDNSIGSSDDHPAPCVRRAEILASDIPWCLMPSPILVS